MAFFDLASLTKPLVTAALALRHLDLDRDRRRELGFEERPGPLTARQLLSHAAGLPPWLPFTGEPLAEQIRRGFPVGAHPLLREADPGRAVYSDLGYRLLAQLLEADTGRDWRDLGWELTGLSPFPWPEAAVFVPDGPDGEAWPLAAPQTPIPPRTPTAPQDVNARAGMKGHAGFGATAAQLRAWLLRWKEARLPERMAVDHARAEDGTVWGLGLQRTSDGCGRFGQLLSRIPIGLRGVHVVASLEDHLPEPLQGYGQAGGRPSSFWMHFGFTGPALFVRPEDGLCIALLLHRRGPAGELLDLDTLRARRWRMLERFLSGL